MPTAAQLRAARGLAGWSRKELAAVCGMSPETIKNIEHETFRPQEATKLAVIKAFEDNDVEFLEDDGVRRSKNLVSNYEGKSGFKKYVDDFYKNISKLDDPVVCAIGIDDTLFVEALGDYVSVHVERMSKIKGLRFRSLVSDKSKALFPSYIEYRKMPDVLSNVLFGYYGRCFDLTIYGEGKEFPKVVVIKSQLVVEAFRAQFESLWQAATAL